MRTQEVGRPDPNDTSNTSDDTGLGSHSVTLDDPPPPLYTYREISDEAKRRTIESGADAVSDELFREVVGHAEAAARERYRGPFSPQKNPHDAIRQEEFQRQQDARVGLEQGRRFRLADLQDAETALAKTIPPGP